MGYNIVKDCHRKQYVPIFRMFACTNILKLCNYILVAWKLELRMTVALYM